MHIVAIQNQQEIYNAAVNLNSKKTIVGQIPIDNLPTGILQVSVFDNNWLPIAERILFVNNQLHQFFPDLRPQSGSGNKRAYYSCHGRKRQVIRGQKNLHP